MKEKTKSISKRALTLFMLVITTLSSVFAYSIPTLAANLILDERTSYTYTGVSAVTGMTHTYDDIFIMKIDGRRVFCIESGIYANDGAGFNPSTFNHAKKDLLAKIAYYGYTNTSHSDYDYVVTQIMIWEELGDQYISSNIPNYHQKKAEIMSKVNRHDTLPSWNTQEVSVTVGDSLTLTDSNGVFAEMALESNTTNANVSKNGNSITITPSASSASSGTITYRKIPQNAIGTSIVYQRGDEQKVVEFFMDNPKQANLKVKVIKLGNVQATKIDEETGKPLANAKLKFEYSGTTKEITTGANGLATINDIPEGTTVKISEVTAPNGYVNKGEIKTVTIKPNETVSVTLNNKEQKGQVIVNKVGQVPINVVTEETDYGTKYEFEYDYKPLADVTYSIQATDDIVSPDGTLRHKKGDEVGTLVTDEAGKGLSANLYLGKYQVVETSAPSGFLIDSTPIPFELTYAGQEVELTSTSLEAKNDFQSLDINVFKNEETISSWKENLPEIEDVQGNGKVFGIYTREFYVISEEVQIPENSLLAYETIVDGVARYDLKLPQGKYYLKELYSGDNHVLNEKEYDFEFTAENNNVSFPIHIYEDTVAYGQGTLERIERTPIINRLYFNQFAIKKVNEKPEFVKDKGVSFTFDELGTGAVFTLEDEKGNLLQEVTIDKEGVGLFPLVPVGTFYLKEKAPSSSNFLLSSEVIRIESTKDGIKAFDEKDNLLGEQPSTSGGSEELTILFTLKNLLKKGTVELTKKDVSTGQLLPDTGIRILDKDKKVIAEGRTDKKGIYTFEQLPIGTYYFQEFDSPDGYELDDSLMKFEIKEDGEIVKCEMTNVKIKESETRPQTPNKNFPQTGDSTNITLFVVGIALSLTVLGVLHYKNRKTKNKGNKK